MSDNIQKAEATLRCTRCGHAVPPPAESTSDDTLIICPACGANLGRWGDAKSEIGKAAAKTIVDEMLKGTGFKLE
jgi:DNA-directed RNA polymerase subunit RPC12/RpoP